MLKTALTHTHLSLLPQPTFIIATKYPTLSSIAPLLQC